MQFFTQHPGLMAALSERADGPMGSSTNLGPSGEFAENRRRFLARLGIDPASVVMAGLVHGVRIAVVSDAPASGRMPNTDGLISTGPGLAITTSDCFPCFFYAPSRRFIGLVHAGWPGIISGILAQAVREFGRRGVPTRELAVAIAPGIQSCCFEVKDDERGFKNFLPFKAIGAISGDGSGRWFVNLPRIMRHQLLAELGLPPRQVIVADACTACEVNRGKFFSHRRDQTQPGQGITMLSVIAFRPA